MPLFTSGDHEAKNATLALGEYPSNGGAGEDGREAVDDARDMRELGRPQELVRQFKTRSLVGFTVTLGATWPYAIVSAPLSLANGGPAGAIWMFLATCVGFGSVVTSLAHAASMQPYSGGPYHWVSVFTRREHSKLLSYAVGWFEVMGWIAGTAGTVYFLTQVLLAIIALFHSTYVIQPWHVTVAAIGLTGLSVLLNYFIRSFRLLEGLVLFISIAGFICYVVVLLALGPRKDVYATFFDFQDDQGWGSVGVAALVGILGPIVTLIGADSTSHLAEETVDARKIVPRAMFASIGISYSFGFIMVVVIMVVSTGYSMELATQTGNAGIAILYNATKSLAGTKVLTIVLFLLLFWGMTNQVLAASRITWAFARDGGLPGHEWISRVNAADVPNGAILVVFFFTSALVLFPLASTIALNVITSFNLASLLLAYLICVLVLMDARFRKSDEYVSMDDSQFPLPIWAVTIANCIAIAFLLLAVVFLCFPAAPHPDTASMNWTCVLLPGIFIFAIFWYYVCGGKKNYVGPVDKLRLFR